MGRMDGRVVLITGAARGQGRAHAVRLAAEGADIIATDVASPIDTVPYAAATPEDLVDTVAAVQKQGGRAVSFTADARDFEALKRANSVHPTNVRTAMIVNSSSARIFRPDLAEPTFEDSLETLATVNIVPEPYVDVADVADAVLLLACAESRAITGVALPVDLGMSQKYSGEARAVGSVSKR